MATCPLSSASVTKVFIYAGYKDTGGTFVKLSLKSVLYKEAFATQTLHSGNQDSALNLTPCHFEVCRSFQVSS